MSLIVCSNRDDNYEQVDLEGNVNETRNAPANSFSNHFSNVFKIPKNAEVAVQSVKIERKNILNLKQQKIFNFFAGKALTTTTNYRDSTNLPMMCRLRPGLYGVSELADEINRGLITKGINCHPDYYGNCQVEPTFDNSATGDGWEGFKYTFNTSGNQETLDNSETLLDWRPCSSGYVDDDYSAISQAGVGVKILKQADSDFSYVVGVGNTSGQAMPLSLCEGIFEFNPWENGVQSYWETGLVRAVNQENPAPEYMNYEGMSDNTLVQSSDRPDGFFDYKLTWAQRIDGNYGLFIEQAIVDEETNTKRSKDNGINYGSYQMVEVRYFGVAGHTGLNTKLDEDNCQGTPNLTDANYKYNKLRLVIKGQDIKLQAFGTAKNDHNGTWFNVVRTASSQGLADPEAGAGTYPDGTAIKVPTSFKPLNMNQWNLYPKIGLINEDDYITITQWGGRAGSGIYPTNDDPGTAFWAREWDPTTDNRFYGTIDDIKVIREMDFGLMINGIRDLPGYTPYELDAHLESPAHLLAILPQSHTDTGYDDMDDYVYSSVKGNSSVILGFPGQTAVLNTKQGLNKRQDLTTSTDPPSAGWILYTTKAPVLSSGTAFVRCNTLTHQSLNMAKQLPSKILYHIPRFSNSGQQFGNLFYEPAEKTYLSLRNTEEMNINEIKLDICNTDETLCKDLTGTTTIVLHFRKARY